MSPSPFIIIFKKILSVHIYISFISSWHLRDDKTIHSEFSPDAPFKLKSKSDNPVLASPFKTKLESEPINSTDIKNLIEQSNYTNKWKNFRNKLF